MKVGLLIGLWALGTLAGPAAMAQRLPAIADDSTRQRHGWRLGLRYTSDYYYMGRADSARAPYLSSSLGYDHRSGLFVVGAVSYLTAAGEQRVDLIRLSGGYDREFGNLVAGLSATAYFFSDQSYAVQAEMDTYLNAYAGYDFYACMVYLDGGIGFSEGADRFLGLEVNRAFFLSQDRLRIVPSIYLNAGSQQYYRVYYEQRGTHTGKGKGHGGTPAPRSPGQVQEATAFRLLDYEASVYAGYNVGRRLVIFVAATWMVPVNPAVMETDQGLVEEALENGFYWSTGARLAW